MDKVTNPETALRHVRHYGYLNAFETLADAWFEASDTPMASSEHVGELIDDEAAEKLIEQGKVVEISRGHPPDDSTTKVICYQAA
jgi:hypothetical protein